MGEAKNIYFTCLKFFLASLSLSDKRDAMVSVT